MPYHLIINDPHTQNQLITLATLWYEESHNEKPKDFILDPIDEIVIINGTFTECYTFDQLFKGKPTLI